MSMRVNEDCIGCPHCSYDHFDDYGCYDPDYYCDLQECPYEYEVLEIKQGGSE